MSAIPPISTLFDLTGKTALVTGGKFQFPLSHHYSPSQHTTGSRGIGLHTATALLLAGASLVIITARKLEGEQGITQAVARLNALPGIKGRAVGLASSQADPKDIEKLVQEIRELKECKAKGGLDVLVANAGATWGGPFEPTPDWSSQKILDLNVRGVFNLVRL